MTDSSARRAHRIETRGARASFAAASLLALALYPAAGCSHGGYPGGHADASVPGGQGPPDLSMPDLAIPDLAISDLALSDLAPSDFSLPDFAMRDLASAVDLRSPADLAAPPDMAAPRDMATGTITGGPCLSGASGATALRVRWTDGGGTANVNYEVEGLPDKTRFKVGVYGYVIGFMPQFVDPFLGSGGVQLDDDDFIDVEISTIGVHSLSSVTVAVYGRSYSVDTSGSFNWMTFTGAGSTATDYVSNVAPYSWYPADATSDVATDDGGILMRIKAGLSSDSLVVNRLEICMDAS